MDPSVEEDREACQAFDFGAGRAAGDVRRWITKWLWNELPEARGETILVFDDENDAPVGYATWMHREFVPPDGPELAIVIEWLGVDAAYQGKLVEDGSSVAGRILDTVEARARAHPMSTSEMPLVLDVDVENRHAQLVWEHFGFRFLAEVGTEQRRYNRLVRAASVDSNNEFR